MSILSADKIGVIASVSSEVISEYAEMGLNSLAVDIKAAAENGQSSLRTYLQTNFPDFKDMQSDIQREVWVKIIKTLIDKGYTVKINPKKDRCPIFISWKKARDEERIRNQIQYLALHTDKHMSD